MGKYECELCLELYGYIERAYRADNLKEKQKELSEAIDYRSDYILNKMRGQ